MKKILPLTHQQNIPATTQLQTHNFFKNKLLYAYASLLVYNGYTISQISIKNLFKKVLKMNTAKL
ncbi:hypothetical protein DID76_04270 [Candidatus Marinamargulisbacteria bacterium SCGC AG-414-C22]|nr:hypothetical protein DID76_04270 [Candidatus Marinamargulisbacteria bacterium SCGC AG-414-C22]